MIVNLNADDVEVHNRAWELFGQLMESTGEDRVLIETELILLATTPNLNKLVKNMLLERSRRVPWEGDKPSRG